MEPIAIGTIGQATVRVDETNLAQTVGSGSLRVFATPMMAALMEKAACDAVAASLGEGETTVGTLLEIRHNAPTPFGMTVTATAEVTSVCGREISFHVTASDEAGVIGEGMHTRFLVDAQRFSEKAEKRAEKQE